jgi:hypothetical protein
LEHADCGRVRDAAVVLRVVLRVGWKLKTVATSDDLARGGLSRREAMSSGDQPLIAAALHIGAVQALARSAKSRASLLCHARAVSVTARWAAIRSSTARRR